IYDEFEKDSESWTGNKVIEPINIGRNVGVGSRADGGTLPAAGNTTWLEHQILCKNAYGRIKVTGPVIRASANNAGAFIKAVTSEIKDTYQAIVEQLDRQLTGNGTGTLALVESNVTNATTVEVDYAGASSNAVSGEPGTRFIKPGMVLNIGTAAEHVAGTTVNATVASVTDRDTFVTSANVTLVAGDIITLATSAAVVADSYNNEIEGIDAAAITTGTYQNINVGTYSDWQMYVSSASGVNRTVTQPQMQDCIDRAEEKGGEIDLIVAQISMRQSYLDMVLNDKRYIGPKNLDAGYIGKGKKGRDLDFNGIPFRFVLRFPYNRIVFLTRKTWKIYPQGSIKWMDEDGAILSRVSGEDAYEAVLVAPLNMGCSQPGWNAYLKDITVTLPTT
ncbi:MAG: phage major capsid protein, partial [Planctomycetota bacterium]|nr:phage major capsid protein [Planctomycetota bacterium]